MADALPLLPFLPFALPEIGEEEIAEVVDTLRSGWVTTGCPLISSFTWVTPYLVVRLS